MTCKSKTEKIVQRYCNDLLAEYDDIFILESKLKEAIANYSLSHKSRNTAAKNISVELGYTNCVTLYVYSKRYKHFNGIQYEEAIEFENVLIAKIQTPSV